MKKIKDVESLMCALFSGNKTVIDYTRDYVDDNFKYLVFKIPYLCKSEDKRVTLTSALMMDLSVSETIYNLIVTGNFSYGCYEDLMQYVNKRIMDDEGLNDGDLNDE